MKQKYYVYAAIVALGLGLSGIGIASAHGFGFGGWGFGNNLTSDQIVTRQQTMFENQAQLLGLSVDEIKAAWAQGKTMQEIMTEKNISQDTVTERIKDKQREQYQSQLQTLVEKGVITQAQADQRRQFMQNKLLNSNVGQGGKKFMRHGFGWGL